MTGELKEFAHWARQWLFDKALPLWWEVGADREYGGFFDVLSVHGEPRGRPSRLRVQTRQLYVYSQAGRLGWDGPWLEATRHAAKSMDRFLRPDGFYNSLLTQPTKALDLYDHSFVLFGMAHWYVAEGGAPAILKRAEALKDQVLRAFCCPDGGYWDRYPVADAQRKSNPLMHLLEAALEWQSAAPQSSFGALAVELAQLGLQRLLTDEAQIAEDFGGGWKVSGPRRYEPGHQYEWCYLLHEAKAGSDGLWKALYAAGAKASAAGAVPFSTDGIGRVTDPRSRLWAQTERLRTAVYFRTMKSSPVHVADADLAVSTTTVRSFLEHPVEGLWHEWFEDGRFVSGDSPATSLYHIMTAFSCVLRSHYDGVPGSNF